MSSSLPDKNGEWSKRDTLLALVRAVRKKYERSPGMTNSDFSDEALAMFEAALSARNAIPDVLFDSYAVYKELRSPDASGLSLPAAAVAEVLDAAVRLIRRSDGEHHG